MIASPVTASSIDQYERILNEFRASAIPDHLTTLNVWFVRDDEAVEILTEQLLRQKVTSYVTAASARILKKYEFARSGGWLGYGCNPDGTELGKVPVFKGFAPRKEFRDGKLKSIKYETPGGAEAIPFQPWVDDESASNIYAKYGITPLEGETFWQAVKRCNLPIAFTEGVKKALSLIAHGIPAIALRGVSCWHRKGGRQLHEAVAYFATPGRVIYIIFDQDTKPSTRANVGREIKSLGAELELLKCKVFVPVWDQSLGKGIDDAIAGQEDRQAWADDIIATAPTLKDWKRNSQLAAALNSIQRLNALSYPVERATEGEYLPELPPLLMGAIHILVAGMNAGKTTRTGKDWVALAIKLGWNVLAIAPLNSLGQQTAQGWGLPHIHDFGTSSEEQQALWSMVSAAHGLVMCPDSLHRIPEWFLQRPLLLVLDEANQVIEHMAEGNTLGSRWADILKRFAAISAHAIQTGAIVLSEDGIPDRAVNFVKSVSGGEKTRVFTHAKKGAPWNCSVFSGQASGFRARLLQVIKKGRRVMVVTSSQREAKRQEQAIARVATEAKVVRIDSETNQQGQFRNFFQSPDAWLEANQPDVLILSPSAKSGVSIEGGVAAENAYFNSVWGYFPILDCDTHMQLLGRYRPAVPRFVFVPQFIMSSGDESLGNPRAIKRRMELNAKAIAEVYQVEEFLNPPTERVELGERIEGAVLDYLASAKAVSGCQKFVAHDALVQRLEGAGHLASCAKLGKDSTTVELWKEVQESIWRAEAKAIASTSINPETHTSEWARKALDSLECSYEIRITALKVLWRYDFPGITFDDSDEVYEALCYEYGALRRGVLLQAKSENLGEAKESDREAAESILKGNIRALHRLPKEYAKARLIAETGVLALLDGNPYSNSDPRAIAIKQKALCFANEINYWLRLQIKPDQTPVEIAHKLLRKLAIEKDRKDRPGEIKQIARPGKRKEQRDKVYLIDLSVNPVRTRLLEAARRKASSSVSSICNSKTTTLLIEDTTPQNQPIPHLRELAGAVVTRAGAIGKWVVEAIAGTTASIKQINGWGFASNVPLEELSLVEASA